MVRLKLLVQYSLVLVLLQYCREPFDVEVPAGTSLLVVNAMITDDPGPYMVKLSRSSVLGSFDFPVETGAVVTIESASGEIETLDEALEGYYFTSENGIRGAVGEQYRLSIQTRNEKIVQSDWKLLKQSPPIDSVHSTFRQQATTNSFVMGIQTFVDTHDPTNSTEFYRYEWIETWKYTVALAAEFEYLGNDTRRNIERKWACWIDKPSTSINIASSSQNVSDIISSQPILYVTTETPRLRFLYSLLVKQYALDQEEFLFWKGLKETVNESGTLFDKQPQSITGNMHRIGSDEPVLGYFSASTVSTQRIFLDRSDLPENTLVNVGIFDNCLDTALTIPKSISSEREIVEVLNKGLVFFDWTVLPGQGIVDYIFTSVPCSDCTFQGGTTEKPDYWPE